jgi:hypothetical protein
MQPKFDQKKFEILTLYPGYDGMVKKPSHGTVPLKLSLIPKTVTSFSAYFPAG